MEVIFNNHASVTIKTNDLNILTDPWFNGSAFNDGWNLIFENFENEEYFLKDINYIWISHEHPDHFQPKFFINNKKFIIENNIKILFQKTKDKRVRNFLKKLNLDVIEIDDNKEINLSEETKCIIFKAEFYDSSLAIKSNNKTLVNLNDCQYNINELNKIKKKCGSIDLLLTQFSYAAWKGGKENKRWRIESANKKLLSFETQCKTLNAKCVIPIASFIYFSHKDNFYMNDSINDIKKVSSFLEQKKINFKILKPNEKFNLISSDFNNHESKLFWEKQYENLVNKELNEYKETYQIEQLNEVFQKYKERIFKKNNKFFMKIISSIKFLKIFQPIDIYISDLKIVIRFDFFSEKLKVLANLENWGVKLHSNSLFFIFKNDFGFDTLSVNALFETDFKNFKKMVFNFAIGSYNAAGMYINLKSLFNLKIYLLVLEKIKNIRLQF